MPRVLTAVTLLAVLVLAGCGRTRLNENKDFELTSTSDARTFTLEPIPKEQTIKVDLTADEPVNVYISIHKDPEDLNREVSRKQLSDKILKHASKEKTVHLEALIPANEKAHVLIVRDTGKVTKGNVKITN